MIFYTCDIFSLEGTLRIYSHFLSKRAKTANFTRVSVYALIAKRFGLRAN